MDIDEWKKILNVEDTPYFSVSTSLDMANQRIVASDVERTRTGLLNSQEKADLEVLLTYYCKEYNTSYKQGMNEIVAPFLIMKRFGLPLHMVYLLFKSFLHLCLPTMFADQNFKPLQAMFLLFRLLLRYFDPRLSTFFLVNNIEPQLFITSWLLTLYAGKINNIDSLYMLWKALINENDVMFPLYISLSIILRYKDKIVTCQDKIVPQYLSQLNLDDREELLLIVNEARDLKSKMPYSMIMKINRYQVFNLESIDEIIKTLQKEACLSILACEVIHRAYPEVDICPCKKPDCPWKSYRGHSVPLVLIDCRPESEQSAGIFPNSILLNPRAYNDSDYMLNFPDQFMPMRNLYHFCFMGTKSYQGTCFDLTAASDGPTDIVQNMIENMLQAFLIKGFSYLSVLDGGFQASHDFAASMNVDLEAHNEYYCLACLSLDKNDKFKEKNTIENDFLQETDKKNKFLKEMVKKSEKNLDGEKFFFLCHKFEEGACGTEEYIINASSLWFEVSLITPELLEEIIKVKMSGLIKLTIIKKNPRILSFRFAEQSTELLFMMKSIEEAKLCVNQITKYFRMSLNFY
jgi:Rab-GTPase-TBC domain